MSPGVSAFTLTEVEKILGADKLAEMISHFSCPINEDVDQMFAVLTDKPTGGPGS